MDDKKITRRKFFKGLLGGLAVLRLPSPAAQPDLGGYKVPPEFAEAMKERLKKGWIAARPRLIDLPASTATNVVALRHPRPNWISQELLDDQEAHRGVRASLTAEAAATMAEEIDAQFRQVAGVPEEPTVRG